MLYHASQLRYWHKASFNRRLKVEWGTCRASSSFAKKKDIMAKQIPQGIQPPTATLKADFLQMHK